MSASLPATCTRAAQWNKLLHSPSTLTWDNHRTHTMGALYYGTVSRHFAGTVPLRLPQQCDTVRHHLADPAQAPRTALHAIRVEHQPTTPATATAFPKSSTGGKCAGAGGANTGGGATTSFGSAGDADAEAVIGFSTFDACALLPVTW